MQILQIALRNDDVGCFTRILAIIQKIGDHHPHITVKNIAHLYPIIPINHPIISGLGKSPKKCMKNMATAIACDRRYLGTEARSRAPKLPIHRNNMN